MHYTRLLENVEGRLIAVDYHHRKIYTTDKPHSVSVKEILAELKLGYKKGLTFAHAADFAAF